MTLDSSHPHPTTFKVNFIGIREEIPLEKFRDAFAVLLKTTPDRIDKLLTRLPYTFKKNIQFDQALRYKKAIETVGGICQIEKDLPPATSQAETPSPARPDTPPQANSLTDDATSSSSLKIPETQPRPLPPKGLMARVTQKIAGQVKNLISPDIPERSIALNFKLPTPSARTKVGSASSMDLYDTDNDPVEFFRLFHSRMKLLNFAKLSAGKRLRANRSLIKIFYAHAKKHLVELAKTGGIPEPEENRQSLILISDIASILVTSYALVFAHHYKGSRYHYARHRKTLTELAASIFELLLLKQRARALRYQSLDPSDWSMANTVFHVMRAYENVELSVPARVSDLDPDGLRQNRTLSDQFVLLQVCAWFDLLRLPTSLQWVIGSYLHKVENAVQIKDDPGFLRTNEILVYCYGKQAAESQRLEKPAGPALILDFHHLVEAMTQDCESRVKFNKADASHAMPRFAPFEAEDHFIIRNFLLNRLNFRKEAPASSDAPKVEDLRLFVGFPAVFSMLNHRRSAFSSEERLEDRLSKRSAVFAVDGRETRRSLWSFSFQNEDMVRITTTEDKETTAMGIGMLLAYGAGDEIYRPRLAVASRIVRHSGSTVELELRFIARFCEAVVIGFNSKKVIGLLVYDHRNGGSWSLAVAPRDVLIGVDKVELHRNQSVTPVTLTAILDASRDFYLLATTLTSSQLGFQGEPQYPAPVAPPMTSRIF